MVHRPAPIPLPLMQPFCPLKSYHSRAPLPPHLPHPHASASPLPPLVCLASSPAMATRARGSPRVSREAASACADANTTFVQADPATFRALVQKLTGAEPAPADETPRQQDAVTVALAPPRRPKLQERRRAAPARLELVARPPPQSLYHYYHHHYHGHPVLNSSMMSSPVSTMDGYAVLGSSSSSSSPSQLSSSPSMTTPSPSSRGGGVVISREEEWREEKAIASKAFYLHSSPRSIAGGEPKLLPLFPVQSPRSTTFAS